LSGIQIIIIFCCEKTSTLSGLRTRLFVFPTIGSHGGPFLLALWFEKTATGDLKKWSKHFRVCRAILECANAAP
jgi:hypothetical protein